MGLLLDYYGYPPGAPGRDLPGTGESRQSALMSALREKYPDPRFHPLVVLHEIEALVLAAIDAGYGGEHFPARELKALRREITRAGGPEKVNDGAGTAPSKRLERIDPQYLKPVTGPNLIEAAGLEAVVERCPTFASWWHGLLA